MSDNQVSAGQKVKDSPLRDSWTVNLMLRAAHAYRDTELGSPQPTAEPSENGNFIKLKNSSGGDLLRGNVLAIGDELLTEKSLQYKWFDGDAIADTTDAIAIYRAPCPSTDNAEAYIAGCCIALISVTDTSHKWADVTVGETVLTSGEEGRVEILSTPTETGEQECFVNIKNVRPTCCDDGSSGSGDGFGDSDCCAGTETALPGDDDCCPPGFVKISTKKFIDLVRFDGDDCVCEPGTSGSNGSAECGEEPSWANDPCDFTCFRFDPANIKNACANECPCTADDIDAAALDGNPLTRYLAADLPEYPDGDDSLITTTGEVYYTTDHWLWKQKTGSRYEYHFRRDSGQFQIIDCTADVASIVDSGNGLYLINALGDEYTIEIDGCGGSVDSSDSGSASTFCPEEGTACSLLTDHTPDTVRVTVSHPEVSDRCRVCDQQETQGVFDLPQTAACNWQANIVTDLCVVSGNNATIQVQIQDNGGGSVSVFVSMYNSGGFNAPCFATDTVIGSKVFPSGFDGTGQHSIPITTAGLNQAGWPYDWENVTFNVDFGNGDACP